MLRWKSRGNNTGEGLVQHNGASLPHNSSQQLLDASWSNSPSSRKDNSRSSPFSHRTRVMRTRAAAILTVLLLLWVKYRKSNLYDSGESLLHHLLSLLMYGRLYSKFHWEDAFAIAQPNLQRGSAYCTLRSSQCFDLERCRHNPWSLYIYPEHMGHERFFAWLGGKQYATTHRSFNTTTVQFLQKHPRVHIVDNPQQACLFLPRIHVHTRSDVWEGFSLFRLRALPYWNGNGNHHILVDPGDDMHASVAADNAIFVRAAFHQTLERQNYDVQTLYLPQHSSVSGMMTTNESQYFLQRSYLASFKGKRKLDLREQLVHHVYTNNTTQLDNENKDVIVLVAELTPSLRYQEIDYRELALKSRFCFAPRGLGLHSYRLVEVLSAGCIPVVISDGYAWPDADLTDPPIRWLDDVAIKVDENDVRGLDEGRTHILTRLRNMTNQEILRRHHNALNAFHKLKEIGGLHPAGGIPVVMRRIEQLIRENYG